MWLLNSLSISLEFFPDDRVPYAILSHRWQPEEVLWEDMNPKAEATIHKQGWHKIQQACQQAQKDGHQYIWIDTISINKQSSAELSEAINSMYRWYENAAICYAYLSDVPSGPQALSELLSSEWFRRGWTLQELIAPKNLVFFDAAWRPIGSRNQLAEPISRLTGIPYTALMPDLDGRRPPMENYSVAQRFSWAAARKTTRVEDQSYCLMGLFGVNMPMLYGEGERAFLRLQEEIIKSSADQSIPACEYHGSRQEMHGLLARSPAQFARCGRIIRMPLAVTPQPYQQTNVGLQISLRSRTHVLCVYHALLECGEIGPDGTRSRIGIFLEAVGAASSEYVTRCQYSGRDRLEFPSTDDSFLRNFVIPRGLYHNSYMVNNQDMIFGFSIKEFDVVYPGNTLRLNHGVHAVVRAGSWDAENRVVTLSPGTQGTAMAFAVRSDRTNPPLVIGRLGFTASFEPWIWLDRGRSMATPINEPSEPVTSGTLRGNLGRGSPSVFSVDNLLQENPTFKGIVQSSLGYLVGDRIQGLAASHSAGQVSIKKQQESRMGFPTAQYIWSVQVFTEQVFHN